MIVLLGGDAAYDCRGRTVYSGWMERKVQLLLGVPQR